MNNESDIPEQDKGPWLTRKRGQRLIKWFNRTWVVKNPKDDKKFGTIDFTMDQKKVTLDMTQLETVDLIACDADGNQFTFRLVGYKLQ